MPLFSIGERPWWKILADPINVTGFTWDVISAPFGGKPESGLGENIFSSGGLYGDERLGGLFKDISGITGYEGMADAQRQGLDLYRQMYEEGVQRMQPFYGAGADLAYRMPDYYEGLRNWGRENMPGLADPFQMRQGPEISPYQVASAPGYNPYQVPDAPGYNPYQIGQGPTQQAYQASMGPAAGAYQIERGPGAYQVERGPVGGMADVMAAPGQGAYQRGTFDFEADPGYQFRKQEMETALDRLGAARGGRQGGRAFKEAARALGGLASEEYGAAYDRFAREEAAKQAAYESGAGRGLQAYGIEAPLRTGVQETAADRAMQEWATRQGLGAQTYESAADRALREQGLGAQTYESAADRAMREWATREGLNLQGYEGAAGRGLEQFLTTEGMRQGESQFGGRLGLEAFLGTEGMRQAGQQFGGQLGLESYLGEQGLRQGAYESAQDRALKQYGMQLPYDWMGYEYAQQDPWRQFQAGYGVQGDYLSNLANVVANSRNAAAGMGGMGQQFGQEYGAGLMNLANIGAQRSAAPFNFLLDIFGAAAPFAPLIPGYGGKP